MPYQLEVVFLEEQALKKWFLYFCKANSESLDPITDALALFLGNSVQFTLSKNGLYIFEDYIPIPFSIMTPHQKQLLYHILSSFRADEHTYCEFHLLEDPLTYTVVNENIIFNIKRKKISAKTIFCILLELIHSSKKPSLTLFNIIIQRLHCKVAIDKETLLFVNETSKQIFT